MGGRSEMEMIETIPLYSVNVHKIHIKEWASVKDQFLSMIPWDEINQKARDKDSEMTWTDYFLTGGDNGDFYNVNHLGIDISTPVRYVKTSHYEPLFLSMISPYISEFYRVADYRFSRVGRVWTQRYAKGDYHPPHDHGTEGFACVFYAELDSKEHQPTEFMQPWVPHTGGRDMKSPDHVVEGDLVIFPINLYHMAPPHQSDKHRPIMSFNLYD